ncbi:MAG: exodeoxyribonuclease III [Candidatus Pacebacteria bacterium]|nr:exodeoxyribonuclease III [Candidatus Paceibacterota bacterium]
MKIISWNVNGIRAWLQKEETVNFIEEIEKPDIFCLQETKAQKEQIKEFFEKSDTPLFESNNGNIKKGKLFPNYFFHFWNSAEKKGYSGTAIFSKIEPIDVIYGIGDDLDNEGRVITLEFKDFFLINVYVPNSKPDLSRLNYRYEKWDKKLLKFLKKLEKKKPVVLCGDLNVAHKEIDLKNPSSNKTTNTRLGNAGFTDKERERFEDFLNAGFIDTFRFLHPEEVKYSWWSYRFNARANNSGWRIDYFLTSNSLKQKIKTAIIYNEAYGSDHCPVGLEIK